MALNDQQLAELKGRYEDYQLKALREKYSDEMIYNLWKRWDKPLLKPGSFKRDPETGEVTGSVELTDPLKEMGWHKDEEGNWYEIGVYIESFQQLLTKRLQDIEHVLLPEIEKIDKSLEGDKKREEYHATWKRVAEEKFFETLKDLRDHGLEHYYPELSRWEKEELKREQAIDLRGANCRLAHFDGANCRYDHFDGANCESARFDGADCSMARFDGAYCWRAHFDGAICSNAHFEGGNFFMARFDGAKCNGANFSAANLCGTSFVRANCYSARFIGANCQEIRFDGATCTAAHFKGAEFSRGHFEGTNCNLAYFNTKKYIKDSVILENPCRLNDATFDKKSSFIGVDISEVDWSKNPRLKRFIEQQQFVHSAKEATPKVLHPLINLIDYLSELKNWVAWALITVLSFGYLYAYLDNKHCLAPIFDISANIADTGWKYIYFSVVTFSTLGFGDITATSKLSMGLVMLEVILGYVFLGGLVTFLANWLGRR